jgi:hypothetical protein
MGGGWFVEQVARGRTRDGQWGGGDRMTLTDKGGGSCPGILRTVWWPVGHMRYLYNEYRILDEYFWKGIPLGVAKMPPVLFAPASSSCSLDTWWNSTNNSASSGAALPFLLLCLSTLRSFKTVVMPHVATLFLSQHIRAGTIWTAFKNAIFWDVTPCGSCKNWRFVNLPRPSSGWRESIN